MAVEKWDDLRLILVLARRGSLKAAAAELGVNVSTIGRRLDQLEAKSGTHFFDRSPDGTLPTDAVEQVLPFAEEMERAALAVAGVLDLMEAEPEGVVRITAPPGFVEAFLAPRLPELLALHPRLRLEVAASVAYADLTRREADIAIRVSRPASGDLVAKRVVAEPMIVIGGADYVRSIGRVAAPADARWLTWDDTLAHLPEAAWVTKHVPPEQIVLESNSLMAMVQAAKHGMGLMLASAAFGEFPLLARAKLARPVAKSVAALPNSTLWLVGHRALRTVPRIAVVWDFLSEAFSKSPSHS